MFLRFLGYDPSRTCLLITVLLFVVARCCLAAQRVRLPPKKSMSETTLVTKRPAFFQTVIRKMSGICVASNHVNCPNISGGSLNKMST